MIHETVFAVGVNKDYIIAKQHPRRFPEPPQKDSTNYYIIDFNKIRQEKAKFITKIDTIKYRTVYKDINGNDSLGKESFQITKSKYVPDSPAKMSYDEYMIRRKELNLPDSLGFNYIHNDLSKRAYWSLGDMDFEQKANYISLYIWHLINLILWGRYDCGSNRL